MTKGHHKKEKKKEKRKIYTIKVNGPCVVTLLYMMPIVYCYMARLVVMNIHMRIGFPHNYITIPITN
jgi:hypothetical protein